MGLCIFLLRNELTQGTWLPTVISFFIQFNAMIVKIGGWQEALKRYDKSICTVMHPIQDQKDLMQHECCVASLAF